MIHFGMPTLIEYPSLEENLNVCDFNDAVAEAYLDTVMQAIALAQRLEAS